MRAAVVLARVQAAGGEAVIVDGRLRLRAARPLPEALVAEVRACKAEMLALLAANDTISTEPTAPCYACGCCLFWRPAVAFNGPGPWRCWVCELAPPDVWQDAFAVSGERWPEFPALQPPTKWTPQLPDLASLIPPAVQVAKPPDAAEVERLAAELLSSAQRNPAVRITDLARARRYFRSRGIAELLAGTRR
jgi:hypothetical protein